MSDDIEVTRRREMIASGEVSHEAQTDPGPRWDTEALTRDFEVLEFAAPFVVVKRRSDGALGSLKFTHQPRVYFGWEPHTDAL
jgi:hypothetical protein